MLRADSFFGCRSNTPYEILAASRSWPNAADGCSRSAAIRYFVADSSGSSARNPVGRRAGICFYGREMSGASAALEQEESEATSGGNLPPVLET